MTIYPITEPLEKRHNRKEFSCGEGSLDTYLQKHVSQDMKRKAAAAFVLANSDDSIRGYYTLASSTILKDDLPENLRKKLGPYPQLPAILLGRLAVDKGEQGKGIGQLLLLDALYRSYSLTSQIGSVAVVVDALNDSASAFYQHYGFIPFTDTNRLFIPMKTISQLFPHT